MAGISSKADFLKHVGSKAAIDSFFGNNRVTYIGIIKDVSLNGNDLILENAYKDTFFTRLSNKLFGKVLKTKTVRLPIKSIDMIEIKDKNAAPLKK